MRESCAKNEEDKTNWQEGVAKMLNKDGSGEEWMRKTDERRKVVNEKRMV